MPRGRAATYDTQREAILAQAALLFAQRGYPATTMKEVAEACGISKPALYHYVRDKDELLGLITQGHVTRLEALLAEVRALQLEPEPYLRRLIERFVQEYADAQHEHRVLTEDVRFLPDGRRESVLNAQRRVVAAFAEAIARVRPAAAGLDKPLAMLLFGMINWMFTWLRPDGAYTHDDMAPVVADLFFGGIGAVQVPPARHHSRRSSVPRTKKETHA
jgi:TetR/AcrR family transcriptional regulator